MKIIGPPDDNDDEESSTSSSEDAQEDDDPVETAASILQRLSQTVTSLVEGPGVQSVMRRNPEMGDELREAKQRLWEAHQADTPEQMQSDAEAAFDGLVEAYQTPAMQPRLPPNFREDVLDELQRVDDLLEDAQDEEADADDSE